MTSNSNNQSNPANLVEKLIAGLMVSQVGHSLFSAMGTGDFANTIGTQISEAVTKALYESRIENMSPAEKQQHQTEIEQYKKQFADQRQAIAENVAKFWMDPGSTQEKYFLDRAKQGKGLHQSAIDLYQENIDEVAALKKSGQWNNLSDFDKDTYTNREKRARQTLGADQAFKDQMKNSLGGLTADIAPSLGVEVGELTGSALLGEAIASGTVAGVPIAGPALLAASAMATLAVTARALDQRFDALAKDLGEVSGPIAGTLAKNEVLMMQAKLERARVLGDSLSGYEEARGELERTYYELGTEFYKVAIPIAKEVITYINDLIETIKLVADSSGLTTIASFAGDIIQIVSWIGKITTIGSPLSMFHHLAAIKRSIDKLIEKLFGAAETDIDKLLGDIEGLKRRFPGTAFPEGLK